MSSGTQSRKLIDCDGPRSALDQSETCKPPTQLQAELTATTDVSQARTEPPPPVPEPMRPAYDVLIGAGMSERDARGLVFGGATPDEARAHLQSLLGADTSLAEFGPKAVAISVLSRIAASEEINGRELRAAIEAHRSLRVVRPDGYIAYALSGAAIERAGELRFADGRLYAGTLEIGEFYASDQGVLYPVNAELQRTPGAAPVFELSLDRMAVGRFLDGTERAVRTSILELGDAIKDPPRSIEKAIQAFGQIGALFTASPELAKQFLAMPLNDQIESVANVAMTMALARYVSRNAKIAAPGGPVSAASITVNVGNTAALTIQLDFAVATAAVSAGRGALGLIILAPLLSVDSGPRAAANPDLSPRAEASMKHVSKLLSKEAAAEKRKALPGLVAENRRLGAKIDDILRDPNLSEKLRSRLESARKSLDDHLNDEDLTGALRDNLELPVREKGTGDVWQHDNEVTNGLTSLTKARSAIVEEFKHGVRRGDVESSLSELADNLLDIHRRFESFVDAGT